MFVYQDKDGNICVTFNDNKPVENPEYVIAIDEDAKALYALAGTIEAPPEIAEEIAEEEDDAVVDEGSESSGPEEDPEDPEEDPEE